MQRTFEDWQELFMQARAKTNWNDMAIYSTELLKLNDKLPWIWINRADALLHLGHPFDAILNYDRALALEEVAGAWSNKGAAYWSMEKDKEALQCYYKALELDSSIAPIYMNIGHVFKWQKQDVLAISAYRDAIDANHDYADGHMALGVMLLKNGQLEEGWKHYEWRWKSDQLPPRGLKYHQWNGEDLTGKTILVYAEQGLGDIIQFARYGRILAGRFPRCKVILEGRQPVKRLLKTIPEVYDVINYGEKVPHVDYVVPMITLAGLLTPTVNDIPAFDAEYLLKYADIEAWGERLKPLTDKFLNGLKVGICWAGMARTSDQMATKIDSQRSTSLAMFAPLAKIPNIAWISLQKGPPASQIKEPPAGMTIGDFTEDMYDFYETCCAIENCDLVISVDTSVIHAAASIGKPTWLLSRWDGCWRWFGNRVNSPWYPSLRQFVQPSPHNWEQMMEEVALELTEVAKFKSETELNLAMAK